MRFPGHGLTRFCVTSKLFFAASQKAAGRFSTLTSANHGQVPSRLYFMINQIISSPARRIAALILFILLIWPAHGSAQTAPEPEREMLLNGLKILYWPQPGNPNVLLKLRIHSGAAFDLADRGGMMALLGDALFPDPATREYVTEELGGKLEVVTSHDAIDVTVSGKASELERMIDLLRGAVLTTQLGVENVTTLRNARIKLLSDKPPSAAEVADQAAAARLFGTFPYGHPASGTATSVAKVERADLLLARERFMNADNASIAVIGGVEKPRMMRALRQLLGPWGKSDRTVPSTFRQPAPPDARVLAIDHAGATNAEIRLAVRGLARADGNFLAANALPSIVRARWQAAVPELISASVRHDSYMLPGIFMLRASVPTASATKAVSAAQEILRSLAQTGPTAVELESARQTLLAENLRRMSQPDTMADAWLDVDTFKLLRPNTIATLIASIVAADIQRVAAKLFKNAPLATVVVGNYDQLKTAFAGNIEAPPGLPNPKIIDRDPAVPIKKP
jgi:zinc protease